MLTPEQIEAFEERKAIMIEDGHVSEYEADALALADILDHYPLEIDGQTEMDFE